MLKTWLHQIKQSFENARETTLTFWTSRVLPLLKALTWKKVVLILIVLGLAALLVVVLLFAVYSIGLPTVEALKDYKPLTGTTILADDGRVLGRIRIEKGVYVPLDRMPKFLLGAVLATEDPRFYEHEGLDYRGILRAALKDIISVQLKQGGSTITQQLAKVVFLSPERTVKRKIKEVLIARRLEKELSKNEILELYLNKIYFGHGAYGVQMAAKTYFGKDIWSINQAEAALLAGLPKAPSVYSPYNDVDLTKVRQSQVLRRMVDENYITEEQSAEIYNKTLSLENLRPQEDMAPHLVDQIRKHLEAAYGPEKMFESGVTVYTSINIDMQRAAVMALKDGLRNLDKRQGFRGRFGYKELKAMPIQWGKLYVLVKPGETFNAHVLEVGEAHLSVRGRGLIGRISRDDMAWALLLPKKRRNDPDEYRKPGDIIQAGDILKVRLKEFDQKKMTAAFILDQTPYVEGAVVAIEPYTGYVRALVGGFDFMEGGFNHATEAYRQPGSAFKPFIYGAALEKGHTPASILLDLPVIHDKTEEDKGWKPENYDNRFLGPMRMRRALALSRNTATVRLLESIGLSRAVDFARRAGITSPISNDFTSGLGSSSVTPLELITAYATIAGQGVRVEPITVKSVVDNATGAVLESYQPDPQETIDRNTAFLLTSMLRSVVEEGTGRGAKWLNRPLAGKTGTTNNYVDAWFVGFTPNLVAGVWVGYDRATASLGDRETGSRAALPVWTAFMSRALEGKPVEEFTVPEDIVQVQIDDESGLLAPEGSADGIPEYFLRGTEPTKYAESAKKQRAGQFYMLDQGGPSDARKKADQLIDEDAD